MSKKLKGTFTALVTPFRGEEVDYSSIQKLVTQQLEGGVDGFVINGTTGESPTLSKEEVQKVFSFVKNMAPQATLILGTGSNDTQETFEYTQLAKKMGADAALVVVPYYNKPPQRGLVAHFKKAADAELPVILYNVPGRTITSLSPESVGELSRHPYIVGIKEATGNIELLKEMKKQVSDEFIFLSGDDGTYIDFLNNGGHGVISVATHVIPRQMVDWKKWVEAGMAENAREDFKKYKTLIDMLFCEANPIPVKMALHKMGILESPSLRLPLVTLGEALTNELIQELKKVGAIK
ncbi:MAG: 4-hydroxy-tetrahydrodipicolinate synthase [Bdellovibrionia bacterium]